MAKDTMQTAAVAADLLLFDDWSDADRRRRSRSCARLHRGDARRGVGCCLGASALWPTQGDGGRRRLEHQPRALVIARLTFGQQHRERLAGPVA